MQERLKILYLSNRVPYPPDKGDRIRTFHAIEHLAAAHDVYCACFASDESEMRQAERLRQWCRDVTVLRRGVPLACLHAAWGAVHGRPLTESAYRSTEMYRRLRLWSLSIGFDVVVAFSSMMADYALTIPDCRRVIDLCDVDSEKWIDYSRASRGLLAAGCRMEAERLRCLETRCLREFDASIVITENERRMIGAGEAGAVHVVPNGVRRISESAICSADECGPVIGFLGTMSYPPNVQAVRWFAERVWPLVQMKMADARFLVVGRRPTRAVRRLGRLPGIEVTGAVVDATEYLARCRVIVAPLRLARGIPNKVLEAMAAGRPVVSTRAVGLTLDATAGQEIVIADEPEQMAEQVIGLCTDDTRCRRIGMAGREFVRMRHHWPDAMLLFERIVTGCPAGERRTLPLDARILPVGRSRQRQTV
ncbi:MAG: TIGR03087 family PEP-CTERM/XrtA system glycosyltransferase [Phycisphaerae bacterium]|nr:TIGR03087 family PEP-CTERM/XrtA system glycosyltransferase [Phycisphaerae bacterium]